MSDQTNCVVCDAPTPCILHPAPPAASPAGGPAPSEVHDREREARQAIWEAMHRWFLTRDLPNDCGTTEALDAYRDAIEARVRWDQQAQAEANG